MWLICYLLTAALLIHSCKSLENPCMIKNMTIMSGSSFKSLVEPGNCGRASINESEFRSAPSIIQHNSGSKIKDKYTFMVMREKKNVHDQFELMWLLSNISPLTNSLTANKTRTTFFSYIPLTANGTGKYWVLSFLQNTKNGLLSIGLKAEEYNNFWPQIWIQRNNKWIEKLVGGLVFTVYPAKTPPRTGTFNGTGRNYTNNTYPNHMGPVYPAHPAQVPPHSGGYAPQPVPPHGPGFIPQPVPPQGVNYPPQVQPQGVNYPPQVPQHGANYPPQVPPQVSNTVIHHHYGKDKKKKNGASAVTAILPLVMALAWASSQL